MSCDIHSFAEVRRDGQWHHATGPIVTAPDEWDDPNEPFGWRSYAMFGFLADVRNYSESPVIAPPRGLPADVSAQVRAKHDVWEVFSASWLTLAELLAYDYDQEFDDHHAFGDEVARTTVRDHLGELFFQHLDDLGKLGAPEDVRVVFWFYS